MKLSLKLFAFLLISSVFLLTIHAQINVDLQIDRTQKGMIKHSLFCNKDYKCGLNQDEITKEGKFTGIEMKVTRQDNDFIFLIDTNQENGLTDEKEVFLKNSSKMILDIRRKFDNGQRMDFSYELSHISNSTSDLFFIAPHYVATGIFKYESCSTMIALEDLISDGKFSHNDAGQGTNLRIDINNDGKFWGKIEARKSSEIIEFCGQNFLVSELNNNSITFTPTDLQIARVGQKIPQFSFTLLNEQTFSSENLIGKHYILDFWAAWCGPCVVNLTKLSEIKTAYKDKLSVFSINVDEPTEKDIVDKIIKEKRLFDYSSIRALGDNDPLWKTFGSESTRLFIPLYVLVDKDGILRYADSGGEDLKDLKAEIEKLIKN